MAPVKNNDPISDRIAKRKRARELSRRLKTKSCQEKILKSLSSYILAGMPLKAPPCEIL